MVGERGQITIPKLIREVEGIKEKDRVLVKVEDGKIVIEKVLGQKEKEALMKEYCLKYHKFEEELNKEWEHVSSEANRFLDEY